MNGISVLSSRDRITPTEKYDLSAFLKVRENSNILVVGMSGSGKSVLVTHLLGSVQDTRFIFSFKANDVVLDMGIPVLDLSDGVPDPFTSPDSFVEAYKVAFPLNMVGVTAIQVHSYLHEVIYALIHSDRLKKSKRGKSGYAQDFSGMDQWLEDKRKSLKDAGVSSQAIMILQNNLKLLYGRHVKPSRLVLEYSDVVLDFSKLNEYAKTFYAEYYLRALWDKISLGGFRNSLFFIDELHRLARSQDSVIWDVMREIRAFGRLWSATQNYTDLPDALSSQFAFVYCFRTYNSGDIRYFSSFGVDYSTILPFLPLHTFCDMRYGGQLERVLYLRLDALPEKISGSFSDASTLNRIFKRVLRKGGVVPFADLRDYFLSRSHKIDVSAYLPGLLSGGLSQISVLPYGSVLYVSKSSQLHEWIVQKVYSILHDEWHLVVSLTDGNRGADVVGDYAVVEVETGLKASLKHLDDRIAKESRRVVIVVPDIPQKLRYAKRYARNTRVSVCTIPDLKPDLFDANSRLF